MAFGCLLNVFTFGDRAITAGAAAVDCAAVPVWATGLLVLVPRPCPCRAELLLAGAAWCVDVDDMLPQKSSTFSHSSRSMLCDVCSLCSLIAMQSFSYECGELLLMRILCSLAALTLHAKPQYGSPCGQSP